MGGFFWLPWHAAALLLIALGPMHLGAGRGISLASITFALVLGVAFLAFAFSLSVLSTQARPVRLTFGCLAAALCYGGALLLVWRLPEIRCVEPGCLFAAAAGVPLALTPYVLPERRRLAVAGLAIGLAGVLLMARMESAPAGGSDVRVIDSALTRIAITTHHNLVAPLSADGGAIERFRDGLLLVTGDGLLYHLRPSANGTGLTSTRLDVPPPIDRLGYMAEQENPARAPRLRVTDMVVQDSGDAVKLVVGHQHWNSQERCFTMRVSIASLDLAGGRPRGADAHWSPLFETWPCLTPSRDFDDVETGGRLAWLGERLLFTVGDHGFNGVVGPAISQSDDEAYGKVFLIDPAGGHRTFSLGHRNPQGLLVDRDQQIWVTEHGPQGGDEINRLEEGRNYGWPLASYGTDYGRHVWPLAPGAHDHGTFAEPVYVFVPSVAVSNLIQVGSSLFPEWRGDLLVSSLRLQSLYRVRLRGDRVTYVEPIAIGHEIRDLAEGADGRIFLWDDERGGAVVTITPQADAAAAGAAVFERCRTCHESATGAETPAPSLRGVVGRPVAASSGYRYSAGLAALGGNWTEGRLDALLKDPSAYAPGSDMEPGRVVDDQERRAVIEFLKTYR